MQAHNGAGDTGMLCACIFCERSCGVEARIAQAVPAEAVACDLVKLVDTQCYYDWSACALGAQQCADLTGCCCLGS